MPVNSENHFVYTNVSAKKDVTDKLLLKDRKHFSQSAMLAAVSKLGKCQSFSYVYEQK